MGRLKKICINKSKSNTKNQDAKKELESFLDGTDVVDSTDVPIVNEKTSIDDIKAQIMKDDHDAINKLMLHILSPQLSENEMQKRRFKQDLMKYIMGVLIAQLVIVGIAFLGVYIPICFGMNNSLLDNNLNSILNFLQYYITAIIVEFIAMLFFIVKFVFDKSIVGLLSDTIDKK